jgi:hypothetical protein
MCLLALPRRQSQTGVINLALPQRQPVTRHRVVVHISCSIISHCVCPLKPPVRFAIKSPRREPGQVETVRVAKLRKESECIAKLSKCGDGGVAFPSKLLSAPYDKVEHFAATIVESNVLIRPKNLENVIIVVGPEYLLLVHHEVASQHSLAQVIGLLELLRGWCWLWHLFWGLWSSDTCGSIARRIGSKRVRRG